MICCECNHAHQIGSCQSQQRTDIGVGGVDEAIAIEIEEVCGSTIHYSRGYIESCSWQMYGQQQDRHPYSTVLRERCKRQMHYRITAALTHHSREQNSYSLSGASAEVPTNVLLQHSAVVRAAQPAVS